MPKRACDDTREFINQETTMIAGMPALTHKQQQDAVERIQELAAALVAAVGTKPEE